MKKLRIGRRRGRGDGLSLSPLELALHPALSEGRWQVPDRVNFARDVVEALADDPKRQALTFIGKDAIIEPRTFHAIAERAGRWSWLLRERGIRQGDPVVVLVGTNVVWLEVVLACLKVGAVVVPAAPTLSAETLDVRLERTGAELVVAERMAEREVGRTTNRPQVLYVDEAQEQLQAAPEEAPTNDSSARDLAFVLATAGTAGTPKLVGHTHAATFAARVAAEHWLDAGRGDAVWCTAEPGTAESIWHALVGPWSRGAETILQDGSFEASERLDLIYRLGVTILCQSPAEYAALAELRELARFRPPNLRRLVSTGEYLDPDVNAVFEEAWGLTIHDGYGQTETGVVVGNGADAGFRPGALGIPLPGHQVAVIDDQGNELPPGVEGELAVRGRPPTLFAGYWESPEQTKQAFRGDWYVTGDVAEVDQDGFFWFVGRSADLITSRGLRFTPYEAERALRAHHTVAASAVVGVRDLERGGQFVRAFVVLEEGAAPSEQLEAELRHEVGQVLPEHQIPREIEFVDELPTAPGWKVRRLELRERLVVGRPLWEMPPTSEPEVDPWGNMLDPWPAGHEQPQAAAEAPAMEALPDYIVQPEPESAEPVVEPVAEPAAEAAPEPEPVPGPEAVFEQEPEPEPEPPVLEVVPEPEPPEAPILEAVPDLPEPAEEAEPVQPEAATAEREEAPPRAGMLPLLEAPPAPPVAEPPAALEIAPAEPEPGPEPVAEAMPALEPEPEPEPVAEVTWTPVLEPEPTPDPAPDPLPDPLPRPEPEPEPEPLPPAAVQAPEPETQPEPAPDALPDFVVERSEEPEPPPRAPADDRKSRLTADDILKPKPAPGPLPDYVVDPAQQQDRPSAGAPSSSDDAATGPWPSQGLVIEPRSSADTEPPLAGLGLPPLTDFPQRDPEASGESPEGSKRGRSKRRRTSAEPDRKSRHSRSSGEPGDEQFGSVDWQGLSSRLSAYSLADEDAPGADEDEDADTQDDAEAGS